MASIQATRKRGSEEPENQASNQASNQSGIALFMVLSAITILSLLVTEFTYVTQVNSRMAFDSLDQIKAHYLAKSGLKLSLLRLKAYQQVVAYAGKQTGGNAGAQAAVPKQIIEKIWSFPFFYPIPTNLPGMSMTQKDSITKFQKESGLEGRFSAAIESESSKFNINSFLPTFAAIDPVPGPSASPTAPPAGGGPGAAPSPAPLPSFNPETARKNLTEYFGKLIENKIQADPDFATEYRDFRLEDFMDNVFTWGDHAYAPKTSGGRQVIPFKKGPFYSVTELHMINPIDDGLYELFSPNLTASTTSGINLNSMKAPTLRAFVPGMADEEVKEFFEFRDDPAEDHSFKKEDEFFDYLKTKVGIFRGDAKEVTRFKDELTKRNVRFVTEENVFKITVQAQVNQASRLIEAWVTLDPKDDTAAPPPGGAAANDPKNPLYQGFNPAGNTPIPNAGLRITFMRLL
ncbi:MAG: general secretion pathway protein GspK [Methylotenera sp.]|nr:general secretion pathway protein GspK [Oligoflexia bacterium]